jgi:hypothetical protein
VSIQRPDARWFIAAILLATLVTAPMVLAGCGGGSHESTGEHQGGEEGDQAQKALERIPEADRAAFLELSTAVGVVRFRAAPVAVGTSSRLSPPGPLLVARSRVLALHPADEHLVRIRRRLTVVLTRFGHAPLSGPAARVASRRAIAAADRMEAGLRAYSSSQPAIGGLIPD